MEEHQGPDGAYIIELGDFHGNILRCGVQSNATKYKSMTDDSITAWYCTCPDSAITIECCLHVASMIWYLSYGSDGDCGRSTARRRLCQSILERPIESQDSNDSDIDNIQY